MEVETFEIEEQVGETAGTTPEVEAEAIELIETLDLGGQRELVVEPEEAEEPKSRIPYPKMDDRERAVYGELYPAHDALENYSAGIIPLRVLQVASHAKTLFAQLYVWHGKEIDPDPILVAKIEDSYSAPLYILARWGDALKPFAELVELARVSLVDRWTRKNKKAIECKAFEATLEAEIEKRLAGKYVKTPW
jgi:hypothetical protein